MGRYLNLHFVITGQIEYHFPKATRGLAPLNKPGSHSSQILLACNQANFFLLFLQWMSENTQITTTKSIILIIHQCKASFFQEKNYESTMRSPILILCIHKKKFYEKLMKPVTSHLNSFCVSLEKIPRCHNCHTYLLNWRNSWTTISRC